MNKPKNWSSGSTRIRGTVLHSEETPKGEQMPQTLEAWRELFNKVEKAMLRDKEAYQKELSSLKRKVNKLEQRLNNLSGLDI
jgi:hypothetical protein